MWPFDAGLPRTILRVGRRSIERWCEGDDAFALVAIAPLGALPAPADVSTALCHLLAKRPQKKVVVVVESYWLPAMLVDTGDLLLNARQVEALVRHRFALQFDEPEGSLSGWEFRARFRTGERHALAFGLRPDLMQALRDAQAESNVRWTSLVPALSWGFARSLASIGRGSHWFVWGEQDRQLIARLNRHTRVVGLHPAIAPACDLDSIERQIAFEAARQGLPSDTDPITVSGWDLPAPRADGGGRLRCRPVARSSRPAQAAMAPADLPRAGLTA